MLRLQTYDFKVVYKPGRSNIADVLSKLNSVTPILGPKSEFQMIALHSTAHCFRQEIEEDSKTDPEPGLTGSFWFLSYVKSVAVKLLLVKSCSSQRLSCS